jgi:hypothetical protein
MPHSKKDDKHNKNLGIVEHIGDTADDMFDDLEEDDGMC